MSRWLLLPALLLSTASAHAVTRTVTNLNDSGAGSLRATITAAASGDTINLGVSGTIPLKSEIPIAKNLTINGNGVTLSGGGVTRIINISSGTIGVKNVAFASGFVPDDDTSGGGAVKTGGTLSLTDCSFTNCQLEAYGARGGAILNFGTLNVTRCTFNSNSIPPSGQGGALCSDLGTVNLTDSQFQGNSAYKLQNSASGQGGAIYINSGTVTARGCAFVENTAAGGGAVNVWTSGTFNALNCTFYENDSNSGGAVYNWGNTSLTAVTIAANSANSGGGGVLTKNSNARILGSIIAQNTAATGADVYSADTTVTSLGHNLIGSTDANSGWISTDQTGTLASPLNPKFGSFGDNGGLTPTITILNTSPAIDQGDDAILAVPYSLGNDQRGSGFPRKRGTHVDVGACEGDAAQSGTSFTVTKLGDTDDGQCGVVDCTFREAINAANAASGSNSIKFASGVSGKISVGSTYSITDSVTITGPADGGLLLDGQNAVQIMKVTGAATTVTMSKVNFTQGGSPAATFSGGELSTEGKVTLTNCNFMRAKLIGRQAVSGTYEASPAFGGAVYNTGSLTLNACALYGNQAQSAAGLNSIRAATPPEGALGGAIYNEGTLNLNNCTLAANTATGGTAGIGDPSTNGGNGQGGAIANFGIMSVNSCTIARNAANGGAGASNSSPGSGEGGGVYNRGTATLVNTVLALNTASSGGADLDGSAASQGFNFLGKSAGSSGIVNGTKADQTGANLDPKLTAVSALDQTPYGSYYEYPADRSPLLDKGKSTLPADQRGQTRPYDNPAITNATGGNGADIGAIERHQSTFSIADVTLTEGNSGTANATFTVTLLDPPTTTTTSVKYATADGTATAPGDYTAKSITALTFSANQRSKTFTVPVVGDLLDEDTETFTVNLSAPINAIIGNAQATCSIVDNDDPPLLTVNDIQVDEGDSGYLADVFTVSLNRASAKTTTVKYATANNSATAPLDYTSIPSTLLTFLPGETTKKVTVFHNGDTLYETNESYFLNLTSPTNATIDKAQGVCTIVNNDDVPLVSIDDVSIAEGNSGTLNAVFTVSLDAASGLPVTVQYATAPVSATANTDYTAIAPGTLTFSAGVTTRTIAIPIKGDLVNEADELFQVNLTNPTNAALADSQGIGKIVNDDPLPALSVNDVAVNEGNSGSTTATFTITLSAISGRPVTVQYQTAAGTAAAGSDYDGILPTAVTFAPGQTTKKVTVPVFGDIIHEDTETFFLNLSQPTNATVADGQGTCTIKDNDVGAAQTSGPSGASS